MATKIVKIDAEDSVSTSPGDDSSVAMLKDGGWVVTWVSSGKIMQQRYKADGAEDGEERIVGNSTLGFPTPTITGLADGGWVISYMTGTADRPVVYQSRYKADGSNHVLPTGSVTAGSSNATGTPKVAALPEPDGGWIVTWEEGNTIRQRVFHSDGSVRAFTIVSSLESDDDPKAPDVTVLSDGGWVVTWQRKLADGSFDIYQQAYNANATTRGGQTLVNTFLAGDQIDPNVTLLSDGSWIVTWGSKDATGAASIHQQLFRADGSKIGGEVPVNTTSDD